MPLSCRGGKGCQIMEAVAPAWVASSTKACPHPACCIKRAAIFTASPITVYSWRWAAPTSPQNRVPVAMPMRTFSPSLPNRVSAQRVARSASSWCITGAPNSANTRNPLSPLSKRVTLPSNWWTIVITDRLGLGCKPTNITVTLRCSLTSVPCPLSTRLARAGGMKRCNDSSSPSTSFGVVGLTLI